MPTPSDDQGPPPRVAGEQYPVLKGKGSELRAFLDELPKLAMRLQSALGAVEEFAQEGAKMAGSIDEFSKEGIKTAGSIRALRRRSQGRVRRAQRRSRNGAFFCRRILQGRRKDRGNRFAASPTMSRASLERSKAISERRSPRSINSRRKAPRWPIRSAGLADKLKDDPSQILRPPPSQRGVVIPK